MSWMMLLLSVALAGGLPMTVEQQEPLSTAARIAEAQRLEHLAQIDPRGVLQTTWERRWRELERTRPIDAEALLMYEPHGKRRALYLATVDSLSAETLAYLMANAEAPAVRIRAASFLGGRILEDPDLAEVAVAAAVSRLDRAPIVLPRVPLGEAAAVLQSALDDHPQARNFALRRAIRELQATGQLGVDHRGRQILNSLLADISGRDLRLSPPDREPRTEPRAPEPRVEGASRVFLHHAQGHASVVLQLHPSGEAAALVAVPKPVVLRDVPASLFDHLEHAWQPPTFIRVERRCIRLRHASATGRHEPEPWRVEASILEPREAEAWLQDQGLSSGAAHRALHRAHQEGLALVAVRTWGWDVGPAPVVGLRFRSADPALPQWIAATEVDRVVYAVTQQPFTPAGLVPVGHLDAGTLSDRLHGRLPGVEVLRESDRTAEGLTWPRYTWLLREELEVNRLARRHRGLLLPFEARRLEVFELGAALDVGRGPLRHLAIAEAPVMGAAVTPVPKGLSVLATDPALAEVQPKVLRICDVHWEER